MGQGKRKPSDQPRIKRPKKVLAGLGIGGSSSESHADQCPVSFQAKINETPLTKDGVPVRLQRNGERYNILISGTLIDVLDIRQSRIIAHCAELDIRYEGRIFIHNEIVYARFKRIS